MDAITLQDDCMFYHCSKKSDNCKFIVLGKLKEPLSLLPNKAYGHCQMMGHGLQWYSHVVLDEPLDFVAGEFLLAEFNGAVFELVAESWWAEQDDSPVKRNRKCRYNLNQQQLH